MRASVNFTPSSSRMQSHTQQQISFPKQTQRFQLKKTNFSAQRHSAICSHPDMSQVWYLRTILLKIYSSLIYHTKASHSPPPPPHPFLGCRCIWRSGVLETDRTKLLPAECARSLSVLGLAGPWRINTVRHTTPICMQPTLFHIQ